MCVGQHIAVERLGDHPLLLDNRLRHAGVNRAIEHDVGGEMIATRELLVEFLSAVPSIPAVVSGENALTLCANNGCEQLQHGEFVDVLPYWSITSAAWVSRLGETVMPSALAALRYQYNGGDVTEDSDRLAVVDRRRLRCSRNDWDHAAASCFCTPANNAPCRSQRSAKVISSATLIASAVSSML